jgi:predicted RNA-binding protein Jag
MEEIKDKIREVFKMMGIGGAEIETKKDNSSKGREHLLVDIDLPFREARQFLEEEAAGLGALQHVLRQLISRKDFTKPLLVIDINRHKKEREKELTELANKAAQKVRRTKKPVMLKSMPAFERRFIHMKLAEQPDIVTESTGEEPERRVVIRLYP